MTRTTINPAPQTLDNKDFEGNGYYFTPTQAKVRDAIQFYERMGINYITRDVFRTFNVSTCQSHKFLHNKSSSRQLYNDPNQK